MERTDEELIMSHQQGDPTAFGELIGRYGTPLLGYLVKMMGNRQRAEDMFQETFVRVHTKAASYREGGNFKAWMYTIATRVSIDGIRKMKRRPATVPLNGHGDNPGTDSDIAPSRAPRPDQDAIASERRNQVQQAISHLPVRQRAALVLSYYHDLTHKEIADIMKCSLSTVKTHLSRALKTLARTLPDPGIEIA